MQWLSKPNVKPRILAVDSFSQRGIFDDILLLGYVELFVP